MWSVAVFQLDVVSSPGVIISNDHAGLQRRRAQLTRPPPPSDSSQTSFGITTGQAADSETISDVLDSQSSVFTFETASSVAGNDVESEGLEPFELLRTVDGDPDEDKVQVPSIKRGDVKTWSKVEARILLWNDGTLRKSGLKARSKKELRARAHQLLFIFDIGQVPRLVSMIKNQRSKPSSLMGSRRPSSDESKEILRTNSIPRPVTPTDKQPWLDEVPASQQDQIDESRERMSGFKGFVSSVFRPSTRTSDDDRLQLTKTRTSENGLEMQRTRSTGKLGTTSNSVSDQGSTGDAIHLADPLPTYKGFDVRAIHVSNPASVVAVRHFPQKTKSFWSSPSKPLSTPLHGKDKPAASRASKSSESVVPACVEVDVAPVRPMDRSPMDQQHGRQREATVGFYFLNEMMAPE
ncbi:hypothetical protein OIV83_003915 [Microbotryomycetes sp. JL201]|nr:hypothetical protein OIV83_003915 [Microbotryomycetes sp. JL201]